MATLFFENFNQNNLNQWVSTAGNTVDLIVASDPLGKYGKVGNLASVSNVPLSYSKLINNPTKSFTLTFDYLGIDSNKQAVIDFGLLISINDNGNLFTPSNLAYAGSIQQQRMCDYYICKGYGSTSYAYYRWPGADSAFRFLVDNGRWNHLSFSFNTAYEDIRIALNDWDGAGFDSTNLAGDSYITNIILTDLEGPDPFLATNQQENFKPISIDVLNQTISTVSYINSDTGVGVDLSEGLGYRGFAEADTFNGILNIIGSIYSDILIGNQFANFFDGAGGDDELEAGVGNDRLTGGEGSDRFIIKNAVAKSQSFSLCKF